MTVDEAQRLNALTNQLAATLMTAAICVDEIRTAVRAELDVGAVDGAHMLGTSLAPRAPCQRQRPLVDESTLCVIWNGKWLHLGNTVAYRLMARLARQPNQYVTHLDLLRDVWDDKDRATSTIRSVVRHLRRRLHEGGMKELAVAIRGHNGRYILQL